MLGAFVPQSWSELALTEGDEDGRTEPARETRMMERRAALLNGRWRKLHRGGTVGARAPDTRAEERKHFTGKSRFGPGVDIYI